MKIAWLIIAFFGWCGVMWVNVRAIKQARAAGYRLWSFDPGARRAAWRGKNLVLFFICMAISAASILAGLLSK
ncbi:hypothetical protein [Bradyrhizobium septentrionale]|uniref:Uncharacterized protein n=1 Tax=Bradyrhizobium septentrionale TaxID=1404411 RepID=A0A973VWU1_9BRAD|nr:hypothetical protein [Bradyrhizobium septentrionale]UGY12144.1 hypothetical protein HAP48_0025715 [Bradyrhizobium septentrionale]UGY29331.1 hypothetical protein HU675_0022925 [Bradyrhizobium septentrionale]